MAEKAVDNDSQTTQTEEMGRKKDKKVDDNQVHLFEERVVPLLDGISLAAAEGNSLMQKQLKLPQEQDKLTDLSELTVSDRMTCSVCGVTFIERAEQKAHYKADWHRFNLKQKLKGESSVTEENFEELMAGDISSISGSDSDDSDQEPEKTRTKSKMATIPSHMSRMLDVSSGTDSESETSYHIEGIGRRHPRVFFRNGGGIMISVYRCVIHGKKNQPESVGDLISLAQSLPKHTYWILIMVAGGHFAAAVFKGKEVVAHKTFHRYVIRAKRGTIQSTRDSQGNAPKSGGASIRREQEKHLNEDIRALLESWSEHVKSCDRIFMRATGASRNIFFSGKDAPLNKSDSRIRMIPFPTRRPTHKEVLRVHQVLNAVVTYGSESHIHDFIPPSPVKKTTNKIKPDKHNSPVRSPRTDSPASSPRHKALHKARLNLATDSVSTSEDEAVEIGYTDDIVDFTQLQTFEATKKPRRRKKKDKKEGGGSSGQKHQKSPANDLIDEEMYHVRNALYTACKTGDMDTLSAILATSQPIRAFASPDSDHFQPTFPSSQSKSSTHIIEDNLEEGEGNLTQTGNSQTAQETGNEGNFAQESNSKNAEENFTQEDNSKTATTETSNFAQNENTQTDKDTIVFRDKAPVPAEVLNLAFGDNGSTLLHVAARANHRAVIVSLLEAGADPAVRDKSGQTPYVAASSKETRNEFRKFMARFPVKFDYSAAQIPGPLTDEMEQEKKAKEAERRKAQKKAKKDRQKEQKSAEQKVQTEQKEKARFLALSDREKRALAAEKRLATQYGNQGQSVPVLSRCFECGSDMTGKVPFEYMEYKFCATKCLRQHREKTKAGKS